MFAAMMAGGRFTYPRLVSSPTTYDQSGAATVRFSPPIGVTTLYVDTNAGGGRVTGGIAPVTVDTGGGQGARADNLNISCADTDLFELTITTEASRGRRVKLTQNGSTVFDLRGGVDGGAGGDAVTPSVTGGVAGTSGTDPGAGSSTSYLSGTVYSGQGAWYGLGGPGWTAYRNAEWPDFTGATDPYGFQYVIIQGPGGGSNQDYTLAEPGYGETWGQQTDTNTSPATVTQAEYPDPPNNVDIARCVITW